MKKYFVLILALIIGTIMPVFCDDLAAYRQDVEASLLSANGMLQRPCDFDNIYEYAKKGNIKKRNIKHIIEHIKEFHCLDMPGPERKDALTAYYMKIYDIMYNLIVLNTENSFTVFKNLVNKFEWNPNIIFGMNKISLIGGKVLSDVPPMMEGYNYQQRYPLIMVAIWAQNTEVLNFIYEYNANKQEKMKTKIDNIYYDEPYEDYVIKYIVELLLHTKAAYHDVDTFKFIYNFAKKKKAIPTILQETANKVFEYDDEETYLIKLLTAVGDVRNTDNNYKLLTFLLDDNFAKTYKNILLKNIFMYHIKSRIGSEDFNNYVFDYDNFYSIISVENLSPKERAQILEDVITLNPNDLNALQTTLNYLSPEDIKNNFDASVILTAASKGVKMGKQTDNILQRVNDISCDLRTPNLPELRNAKEGSTTISLFAYWAYKYSGNDDYLYIAKKLGIESNCGEKLLLTGTGERTTAKDIIRILGTDQAKATFCK